VTVVGTVGYVYDANGVELAVVYRMLDHSAVLPLLTAAPELRMACLSGVRALEVGDVDALPLMHAALAKAGVL